MKAPHLISVLLVAATLSGCRAHVVKISVTNSSSEPIKTIIVDYPSATFGKDTLAPQSTGVLVSGLVSSMSLPWFPPVGHSPRCRLPARGSLGPRFPTFPGTMRRDDCHRAPLGSLRL